jgi:site-specific recombinase XerD
MTFAPEIILHGEDLEAWRDYARSHREQRHSERTIQSAGEALAQLQCHLGTRPVLQARREDLSGYLISLAGRGLSASTQNCRYRALRTFFAFCVLEDILDANPAERVKAPAPDYHVPEVLEDEQLLALIAACAGKGLMELRDTAIIRILCEPGSPRRNEMAAIDVADVDLAADQITIRRGKNQRTRIIGMSPATARSVSRYRRARAAHPRAAESTAMWLGHKGPVTGWGIGQMIARRAEAAGLGNVHPHQLRHTAFSDFDQASGGNINAEMALFGWSNPAMAHHYGRQGRERAALRTAAAMNRGARLAGAR